MDLTISYASAQFPTMFQGLQVRLTAKTKETNKKSVDVTLLLFFSQKFILGKKNLFLSFKSKIKSTFSFYDWVIQRELVK